MVGRLEVITMQDSGWLLGWLDETVRKTVELVGRNLQDND